MITKKEKIIAALGYIFELGIALSDYLLFAKEPSAFLQFHFSRAKKLIWISVGAGILAFVGLIVDSQLLDQQYTLHSLVPGALVFLVYVWKSALGIKSAMNGEMKSI